MAKAIPIELDKLRRLRFDINALSDFEEAMGTGIMAAMKTNMGIRAIRTMCWAGLKWEDRGLTQERMGTILQKYLEGGGSLEVISESLARAVAESGLFSSQSAESEGDEGNGAAEAAT